MKNRILPFLLFIVFFYSVAQNKQAQWNSYFSYKNNTAIAQSTSNVFVVDNISFYKYNVDKFDKQHFSSINGLNAFDLTCAYYSEDFKTLILGNSNGIINLYKETNDVFNVITGIAAKNTLTTAQKKINAISEFDGIVYIATEYGITELFLNNNLLGDTYFIGNLGDPLSVLKVLKFNNYLYAITRTSGIKRANVNTNLLGYQNWNTIDWNYWKDGVVFNNQLILVNSDNNLYRFTDVNLNTAFYRMDENIVSIKNYENNLLFVATKNQVKVFDANLNIFKTINLPQWVIKDISVVNDKLFIGTLGHGTHQVNYNTLVTEDITPSGPERNNIFKLKYTNNNLWAVYGDYTQYYNPYPLDYYGISFYNNNTGWQNYTNQQVQNAVSIVTIQPHPTFKEKIFFGSFYSGLLESTNFSNFKLFDQNNTAPSGLQGIYPNEDIRVGAMAFDTDQNLWILNSRVNKPLVVMKKDGTWQNFSLSNFLATVAPNENFGNVIIDADNTKWISTFYSGLLGYNEKQNRYIRISSNTSGGTLPSANVTRLALDHSNQLWIGTDQGLRVSSSVDRFINDNTISVQPIIFLEDGVPQELFNAQNIKDIEVDGSNNKWISILGAGVFQVSDDGQKVLQRFNTDNSPLPSNNVNDIEINGDTGEVFFATDKGLYSFKGDATSASDNLDNVYIYPNPVRPGFEGDVKISGLMRDAIVKITDISGNLVFETTATGGTVLWNQRTFNKHKVASGVYMVFITHVEQKLNKTKKIMIIR